MKKLLHTLIFFLLVTQICFAQWTNIGLQNRSITDLAVDNDVIFVTTGDSGRVLRSTDGGNNWLSVTPLGMIDQPGVVAISPLSGSVFVSGAHYSYAWTDTLYRSTDNGNTWLPTFYSNFLIPNIAVDPNGIIFTGYSYFHHSLVVTQSIRSIDDGMSWAVVCPRGSGYSYAFRGDSVITLGFTNMIWPQIFLSSDSGSTWQNLFDGAPGSIVSWNSDGSIVCGGDNVPFPGALYRSTDLCSTWTKISSICPTQILSLSSGGMLVGTDSLGVFLFSDNGDSLGSINEGLSNLNTHTLSMDNGGYVYVGTDNGVWRRPLSEIIPVELTSFTAITNGKEVILNWSTATELNNLGFEIKRASSKAPPRQEDWEKIGFVSGFGTTTQPKSYSYSDQSANSGTNYYRLKQVDFDGSYEYSDAVEVDFRTFNSYLLEQNFPNPFNPTTTIGFGLQNKSNVKITILNVIGEEVAVVLNEEREPGFHQVEFSAKGGSASGGNAYNLSSGVYFYQLRAGSFIETKKMLLLK